MSSNQENKKWTELSGISSANCAPVDADSLGNTNMAGATRQAYHQSEATSSQRGKHEEEPQTFDTTWGHSWATDQDIAVTHKTDPLRVAVLQALIDCVGQELAGSEGFPKQLSFGISGGGQKEEIHLHLAVTMAQNDLPAAIKQVLDRSR